MLLAEMASDWKKLLMQDHLCAKETSALIVCCCLCFLIDFKGPTFVNITVTDVVLQCLSGC